MIGNQPYVMKSCFKIQLSINKPRHRVLFKYSQIFLEKSQGPSNTAFSFYSDRELHITMMSIDNFENYLRTFQIEWVYVDFGCWDLNFKMSVVSWNYWHICNLNFLWTNAKLSTQIPIDLTTLWFAYHRWTVSNIKSVPFGLKWIISAPGITIL